MVSYNPIVREIERQIQQKFIECKKGDLGKGLRFEITEEYSKYALKVAQTGIIYRKAESPKELLAGYRIPKVLEELADENYALFHALVKGLKEVFNNEGKAKRWTASTVTGLRFGDYGPGIEDSKPVSGDPLEIALKWRWGPFEYKPTKDITCTFLPQGE